MTPTPAPIGTWLDCFRESSLLVAATSLRLAAAPPPAAAGGANPRPGSYITLNGDTAAIRLGVISTPDGCRAIARGLLGIRPGTELPEEDVKDGMSEVINIIAGQVKAKMIAHDRGLRLGLPMFVLTPIPVMPGMETASADVKLGPVECQLVVYRTLRVA